VATKRQVTFLVVPLLVSPLVLGACSSGGSTAGSAGGGGGTLSKAPEALCQQLNGIFSDGPDPDADPVGYALSQVEPLEGVHTSDTSIKAALARLIPADQQLVNSNGADKAAATTIRQADEAINRSCPGVAP
jgi:hypothetical protein